ncbi:M20 family metallopeptidase [Corynebacterium crudilactis]|uniref:N-acyl-L-amino acid amidohydrolase n=1 Tax=Corynebacterium crudilactis TaxID=1652495 RepID=A0A172QRP3_9CORY|nr:M20 family metallopeptidase [Corynebacterium crudilactis]ANE03356.1 N-acyl-L-amino acid amidohydrolase [Corynebacterium crudilactis]
MEIGEQVVAWMDRHHDEVIEWRRHLHSHPELSHMEYRTTEYLASVLKAHGLDPHLFPGTGLMVDIGPEGDSRLAFRADIDALPLVESTELPFASQTTGVAHACGHDVHTVIALALACALSTIELPIGIRVIFQPAEEVMTGGATDVIAHGGLDGVDAIYAIHVEPKLKVGRVGIRAGAITSASDVIEIRVKGEGGHSARPHLSADVVYALSKLVVDLPGLLSRRIDPRTGTVLVFGTINAGYAPNAIPDSGSVSGTLRTADISTWRDMRPLVAELVEQVLAPTGVNHELIYNPGVPPVLNDDVATALLASAARDMDTQSVVQAPQSSGGEDFSWYLEHVPGSMARLGCWPGYGPRQDLHQSDLVVDERAIGVGVRLFGSLVQQYSSRSEAFLKP